MDMPDIRRHHMENPAHVWRHGPDIPGIWVIPSSVVSVAASLCRFTGRGHGMNWSRGLLQTMAPVRDWEGVPVIEPATRVRIP